MSFFTVHQRSNKLGSRARRGTIATSHGVIHTPAFVPVATKGSVKSLSPERVREIAVQTTFVNSYHLVVHPGSPIIRAHGSIHSFAQMPWTIFSDSGGFQIFSLARSSREGKFRDGTSALIVHIGEEKVVFRSLYDGALIEFTPESSMGYQIDIGADIIMAFDECTYYPATREYTMQAMQRTHEWLHRCINYHQSHAREDHAQYLYGIIQGGDLEDTRVASAKVVCKQDVSGIAIGGVSVGESKGEMRNQVRWVSPYLPDDKPVHLLGVGQMDDIVDLVGYGIDTFDCVEPTRLARMGILLVTPRYRDIIDRRVNVQKHDITEKTWKAVTQAIDSPSVFARQFTYAYLHHLFKQREILGYEIATSHNLAVMEEYMARVRDAVVASGL